MVTHTSNSILKGVVKDFEVKLISKITLGQDFKTKDPSTGRPEIQTSNT